MSLLIVSDFDPEGLELADDAIRSVSALGVPVDGHRVAVTKEQIDELNLAEDFNPAKESSTRFKSFRERTGGTKCWECEALPAAFLIEQIQAAIEANMDMEVYECECEQEEEDCEQLCELRGQLADALRV